LALQVFSSLQYYMTGRVKVHHRNKREGGKKSPHSVNRNWECDKLGSVDSLTTLDAVPPGQQASRMSPAERDGGSPSARLTIAPNAGIMVYCAAHPNKICSRTEKHLVGSTKPPFGYPITIARGKIEREGIRIRSRTARGLSRRRAAKSLSWSVRPMASMMKPSVAV
jgi:hypothetical protein